MSLDSISHEDIVLEVFEMICSHLISVVVVHYVHEYRFTKLTYVYACTVVVCACRYHACHIGQWL